MSTAALTVPHPSMLERAFVLRPLLDLDAGLAITGAGRLDVALQRLDAQRCERHASARALRVAAAAGGLVAHGITVVGAGRLGTALTGALRAAGVPVDGPFGRGTAAGGARIVLLCVPDHAIAAAASAIAPGRMVGHCSGAATLDALTPHESFSMHPLMTVTRDRPVDFRGAGCAVAGSTPAARATAESIGRILGMRPVEIADADRALYHAAATMASNYLVTLETVAAALAEQVGVSREMLAPLVRASATNWGANGGAALTGPIVRGDAATVARQRAAIEARDPRILALWDALVQHTSALATGRRDE